MQRIIAILLIIVLSPLILLLYLVIELTSKGTFVYKQKRTGKNFVVFELYKIRTMCQDAENQKSEVQYLNEADGPVFKIHNDPRFTRAGKFLSRTGLDEILQLINIIKGEMVFVGPRPLPVNEANSIPKKYSARFSVLPGLTSYWIIRGAHSLTFAQWMNSDLEYIEKKNTLVDLYIMVITIGLILRWTIKELIDFAS